MCFHFFSFITRSFPPFLSCLFMHTAAYRLFFSCGILSFSFSSFFFSSCCCCHCCVFFRCALHNMCSSFGNMSLLFFCPFPSSLSLSLSSPPPPPPPSRPASSSSSSSPSSSSSSSSLLCFYHCSYLFFVHVYNSFMCVYIYTCICYRFLRHHIVLLRLLLQNVLL